MNYAFVAPASRRLAGRHAAFALLVLAWAAVVLLPAGAKTKPSLSFASRADAVRPDRVGSSRHSDLDYIPALATANRFLQAWQTQDHEAGLLMLTDAAKQHSSEDRMDAFFSSGADAAYEIARGRKVRTGRYAFPVTLFPSHSSTARYERPQKSEILVVRTGKDEWAIDRLP